MAKLQKKIALIVYYKNLNQYPKRWILEFYKSITNQTVKPDILELNYGGDKYEFFWDRYFYSEKKETFADAMNFLLKECVRLGYDYVFNTNVDDFYSLDRIEKQLPYLKAGYDIVSSNFALVKDDKVTLYHQFDKLDIKKELAKNHNVICHPVVAYSRKFIEGNGYNPDEIPHEDLKLWQRTIDKYKFIILPDNLCYHRTDKHL